MCLSSDVKANAENECINGSFVARRLPEICSDYLVRLVLLIDSLTWQPQNLRLSLKFVSKFQCWLRGLAPGLPDLCHGRPTWLPNKNS